MTKAELSMVNNRLRCGMFLRKTAIDKNFGLITNVKLTRISFGIWHIQFDIEIRE